MGHGKVGHSRTTESMCACVCMRERGGRCTGVSYEDTPSAQFAHPGYTVHRYIKHALIFSLQHFLFPLV